MPTADFRWSAAEVLRMVVTHSTPLRRPLVSAVLVLGLIAPSPALERLEPPEGCYFGVNIGDGDTIETLSARLGITPAVYVRFFHFPLTSTVRSHLVEFLEQVRLVGGIALITLEPFGGLTSVTEAHCLDLAKLCATNESRGIGGILIRFAHEMNGNWYPWCQQPIRYKEKFRLLSRVVRTNTTRTAMLWAPNNGIGYPFSTNGLYQAARGSADFTALDTNGDSRLTTADDMYEPFYPGDDVVDWVGMTIYHWGANYPWLENEMPPPNIFARTLRGEVQQPPIPNFYARYCGTRNKPLAIPETAAFYNTQQPPGPGEFQIKQAWWKQVFNISGDSGNAFDVATHFPKLKCINWFDHFKRESEAQGQWVDWRISASLPVSTAFVDHLHTPRNGRPYFLTAADLHRPRLELSPSSSGMLWLKWESWPGRNYQLFRSSDSTTWTPLGSVLNGTGAKLQVPIDPASTGQMMIYRLRVSP